jgi:hypothetical protein
MNDEHVDVMMVAGGGRLDVLCREVAARTDALRGVDGPFALLCDEHGAHEVVRVDGVEVAT